jgi:putative endonuclease
MHYVYIIYSETADKYYVGSTTNPEGRLQAHNHPMNKGWTKRHQPWELVYTQGYTTKVEAEAQERKIKSYKSKKMILHIINTR